MYMHIPPPLHIHIYIITSPGLVDFTFYIFLLLRVVPVDYLVHRNGDPSIGDETWV